MLDATNDKIGNVSGAESYNEAVNRASWSVKRLGQKNDRKRPVHITVNH